MGLFASLHVSICFPRPLSGILKPPAAFKRGLEVMAIIKAPPGLHPLVLHLSKNIFIPALASRQTRCTLHQDWVSATAQQNCEKKNKTLCSLFLLLFCT